MSEDQVSTSTENVIQSPLPVTDTERKTTVTETPPEPARPIARRPTLSELALGSALLVGDAGARLQVPEGAAESTPRTLDAVLRPVAEWDTLPSTPLTTARHITVGMLTDARASMSRGGRLVDDATDVLGRALDRLTRPVRHSRPMRPLRVRFQAYQQRGERQVARWEQIGRLEEVRSRAVAEASLGGFVHQSVADLTESKQVQVLVQQVVESQSTGMIQEVVEEIRERNVSLDILVGRRIGRDQSSTPTAPPPFRSDYLRNRPALSAILRVDESLAGQYAGFVSRSAAFLIDVTLLIIALSLVTTFANATVSLFSLESLTGRVMTTDGFSAAIAAVASTLFIFTYGVLAWGLNGQTVGDILLGVRVVRANDGGRITFGRAMVRMVGAYIAGIPFLLGFFWALFDRRRQGWHDKLAGTVVVYDWPAVPDELFLREAVGVHGVLPRQERAT